MRVLGNILWFLFGGLELGLAFCVEGLISMVTLIGIPFGLQWFKMVPLVFCPFGKGIRYPKVTGGKVFGNVLWALFFGWWNAILCFAFGLLMCITIVGIPFGKQWFKLARMLFLPFGAEVYNEAAEKKQEKKERKREEKLVKEAAAAAAVSAVAAQNNLPPASNTTPIVPTALQTISSTAVAVADNGLWTCPVCGNPDNESEGIFCEGCGYNRTAQQNVNTITSGVDFKEKTADVGKKTAVAAAAVGTAVSDVTVNKVVPFFKGKFIPAMKKAGIAIKNGFIRFGSFVKKQSIHFAAFLKAHKEQIKSALPVAASVAVGIAAVVLIVVFINNASAKSEIISAYNAEKQEYNDTVSAAEAKIKDYEDQADKLNEQKEQLEASISEKNAEYRSMDMAISELTDKVSELTEQKNELSDSTAMFNGISAEYNTSAYAEEQLTEIIVSQQEMIYNMKQELSGHIELIYEDFRVLSGYAVDMEYLYQVEAPMDISKEFAKEIIGAVAGEFGSEIADLAAGVASDMVDGSDLSTAVGSQLQGAVQSKIEGAHDELVDAATGGLYSKFNEAVNVVEHFESLYNKVSDTTPTYCLRYIYQEMQQCITEIGVFLDDDSVTAEDVAALIDTVNRLSILEKSYQDLSGIGLFTPYIPSLSLCDVVQDAYNQIIVDNERMAYYFALMEE